MYPEFQGFPSPLSLAASDPAYYRMITLLCRNGADPTTELTEEQLTDIAIRVACETKQIYADQVCVALLCVELLDVMYCYEWCGYSRLDTLSTLCIGWIWQGTDPNSATTTISRAVVFLRDGFHRRGTTVRRDGWLKQGKRTSHEDIWLGVWWGYHWLSSPMQPMWWWSWPWAIIRCRYRQ